MAGRYTPFRFPRPTQTAAIDILPEEILTRIFFIICDEIIPNCTSRFPRLRKKSGIMPIAGVCSRWRTIAKRTMAFLVLELPIEATMESIAACQHMISSTRAADMDMDIDFTRRDSNNARTDADCLGKVMDVILPHSHRWRSLKIFIRASSSISPILRRFQAVNHAPRLRVFDFMIDGGARVIPSFPLPGLVNNPHPLPLTHLSVCGARIMHIQNFQLPNLVDLEILDRAEDRELTLPWHEIAFLLKACPGLRALKLDCNIDYVCLRARQGDTRSSSSSAGCSTSTSTSRAPASQCVCNGQVGRVFLRSLTDLRVNRYDVEEITALVLQLELPSIESLTLCTVDVYPTLQTRTAPGKSQRDRSRLPSVVHNRVFERVRHLTVIDLEFDRAKTERRSTFTASFFDAFPNLLSLKLLQCPEREFLAALVPQGCGYLGVERARCPQLQTLRIEGGHTGPVVDFVLARQTSYPIDALFLINTVVDQHPRDLIILDANVDTFDHGDFYRPGGAPSLGAPPPAEDLDMEADDDEGAGAGAGFHGMMAFHG